MRTSLLGDAPDVYRRTASRRPLARPPAAAAAAGRRATQTVRMRRRRCRPARRRHGGCRPRRARPSAAGAVDAAEDRRARPTDSTRRPSPGYHSAHDAASIPQPSSVTISPRDAVAPPGFCNRGEVRYGSIGGLEYEVPQPRLYCLCINVALCSTALHAMHLSCDKKKFHDNESTHILHNFWSSTHRRKLRPFPTGGATGAMLCIRGTSRGPVSVRLSQVGVLTGVTMGWLLRLVTGAQWW